MKENTRGLIGVVSFLFLSAVFLAGNSLAQADRGMGVSPDALPKALRDLSPKDFPISTNQKKVGLIHALEGKAVVVHRTTNEAFFAMEGDPIHEKDAIHTLADSRCRIRFLDEDVVTMAPDAEFSVESFEDQRAEGKKSSLFSMARGKAMFYALRLFRYRDTRFNVNTPTVTVGVRGTSFGVDVYSAGEKERAESKGVLVADLGNEIAPYLAQVVGPPFITNAFSLDGSLVVAGQFVGPGQMFNGQTNQIIPTPPNVILNFQQATGMGVQGQQSRSTPPGGTGGGTQPLIGTGGLQNLANLSDLTSLVTNQTSVQTGVQTEQEKAPPKFSPLPGPLYGYFSLLLNRLNSSGGVDFLYDAFGYRTPGPYYAQTDPNIDAKIYGVAASTYWLRYLSTMGQPDVGEAFINGKSGSGFGDVAGAKTYLGQNAYTQWGYWQAAQPFVITVGAPGGPEDYQFVSNRVWFAEGNHLTTTANIASMPAGNYGYSGVANGTWSSAGAFAHMSGPFTANVNFGSAYINNFLLNVSGGGHTASFTQSSSNSISHDSSGNYFYLSGTGKVDGVTMGAANAQGSLYGGAGQEMAGRWGMYDSASQVGAAGNFAGKR